MGGATEKLLLVHQKPVVLRVIDALRDSGRIAEVLAATSPNAPATQELLDHTVRTVRTDGRGYVHDLNRLLCSMEDDVLVVPGDMPLLDGGIIRDIASGNYAHDWTSIVVTRDFAASLGLSGGFYVQCGGIQCVYTGVSVVRAGRIRSITPVAERHVIMDDRRIAFNLNTARDYELLGASGDLAV